MFWKVSGSTNVAVCGVDPMAADQGGGGGVVEPLG